MKHLESSESTREATPSYVDECTLAHEPIVNYIKYKVIKVYYIIFSIIAQVIIEKRAL